MFENKTNLAHEIVDETQDISVRWCHKQWEFVSKPVHISTSNPGEWIPSSMLPAMATHGRKNVVKSCFLVNIFGHQPCNI